MWGEGVGKGPFDLSQLSTHLRPAPTLEYKSTQESGIQCLPRAAISWYVLKQKMLGESVAI